MNKTIEELAMGKNNNLQIGTCNPRNEKLIIIEGVLRNFFLSFPPEQIEDILSEMFDFALSSEMMDGSDGNQRLKFCQLQKNLPELMKDLYAFT